MPMSLAATLASGPPVLSVPAKYLVVPPVVLVLVSISLFSRVLPSVIRTCSEECEAISAPLAQTACFFSAFFQQCFATDASQAFMATFLAFVAALLTISHVEASRLFNQPSNILTRPAWTWAAVNAVTGAVVSPAVLCANIKRHRDGAEERRGAAKRRTSDEGANTGEARPLIMPESDLASARSPRHLVSVRPTYAIPVAVALGFVLPSILLMADPNPLVAALWNLFPIAVHAIYALMLRVLGARGDRTPHHAEIDWRSVGRIYSLPVLLSLFAHAYLVTCWLWFGELQSERAPAVALMVINFWTIAATYLYWLLIESSVSTVALTVLASCLAGPGAGISAGWVRKEWLMGAVDVTGLPVTGSGCQG